jgi:hypothetical protein
VVKWMRHEKRIWHGDFVGVNPVSARPVVPLFCVGFHALHSYLIGNIMFPFAVRPGQSGSNQVRVGQTIRSSEARERRVLAAEVIKGCEMARFDATLLVR